MAEGVSAAAPRVRAQVRVERACVHSGPACAGDPAWRPLVITDSSRRAGTAASTASVHHAPPPPPPPTTTNAHTHTHTHNKKSTPRLTWQSKQSYTALAPPTTYIVPTSASQLALKPAASLAPDRSGQLAFPRLGVAMHPASTAQTDSSAYGSSASLKKQALLQAASPSQACMQAWMAWQSASAAQAAASAPQLLSRHGRSTPGACPAAPAFVGTETEGGRARRFWA